MVREGKTGPTNSPSQQPYLHRAARHCVGPDRARGKKYMQRAHGKTEPILLSGSVKGHSLPKLVTEGQTGPRTPLAASVKLTIAGQPVLSCHIPSANTDADPGGGEGQLD